MLCNDQILGEYPRPSINDIAKYSPPTFLSLTYHFSVSSTLVGLPFQVVAVSDEGKLHLGAHSATFCSLARINKGCEHIRASVVAE